MSLKPSSSRAGGRAPGGPGRRRGTAARARAAGRRRRAGRRIFGSSSSRGSPGPGPTMTRSAASRTASARRRTPRGGPRCSSARARRARGAACSRSRPRRRGPPRACRAAAGRAACRPGRSARSVESRRLRALSASSTSSSLTSSARSTLGTGAGGTRPKALRMPPALACVSATSYAGSESRTRVAPAVTVSRPSRSTSAVRITIGLSTTGSPVGVAAEDRQRGAVVAAALGLVLLDQPAGVLDRRAGDRGGVHRVAQHLARVAGGAAGEEVLGVDQVAHRLEERPEHLAALVCRCRTSS